MRRRLFWKILVLFWLTFMAMVEGVWVVFAIYGAPHKPLDVKVAERLARLQVASAAAALERGGEPALRALLAAWPGEERRHLTVAPAEPAEASPPAPPAPAAGRPGPLAPVAATVWDPEGRPYHLTGDAEGLRQDYRPPGPLNIPLELLSFGLVGGLLFSATLAWYLTKPIQRLRDGFAELAQGRLGVRLEPGMGRRRDELADLARDFDLMATRLQQSVATRERLLHDVSHELRSPLARLHLAMGLARQDPRRLAASLDRIELETQRLDAMVGELLTLARAEAGGPQMEGYFDLASLARTVTADASFEAQASGARVATNLGPETDAGESLPTVKGNAELMRRALENVVRNALRHSPPGRTVAVQVAPDWVRKAYLIRVADQGPGVDPATLPVIFEPFVRAQGAAPPSPQGQGFGLGLAIARKAVLAHGGAIAAENRPEGGLLVTIRLPFGPPPPAAEA